jgi:hypothetical protein
MHWRHAENMGLNVLFYRKIEVLLLSKACVKNAEFGPFLKSRNFSTVDNQGYYHKSFALLEIVHYVCSPFPQI